MVYCHLKHAAAVTFLRQGIELDLLSEIVRLPAAIVRLLLQSERHLTFGANVVAMVAIVQLLPVPSEVFALVAFVFMIVYTLLPVTANRRLLWETIGRVLISPFSLPLFRDGHLGDIFTSMSTPLQQVRRSPMRVSCRSPWTFFFLQSRYPICFWLGLHVLAGLQTTIFFYNTFGTNGTLSASWYTEANITSNTSSTPQLEAPPTYALSLCAGLPLWWRLMQNCHGIYKASATEFLWKILKLPFFCAQRAWRPRLLIFGCFTNRTRATKLLSPTHSSMRQEFRLSFFLHSAKLQKTSTLTLPTLTPMWGTAA